MITPRPYQKDAIEAATAYLTAPARKRKTKKGGHRHGLIVAPTGSGKSVIIAGIAHALAEHGDLVVLQPSKEILEQNAAKLAAYGYRPAIYSASLNRKEVGAITLATIGSVIRNVEAFPDLRFLLIDEAHAVNPKGGMYDAFIEAFPEVRAVGLTATPYRLHSNSMGSELRFLTRTRPNIFTDVVHVTQIGDLFTDGFLSPLAYREVSTLRADRLRLNTSGSDYDDRSVEREMAAVGFVGHLHREVRQAFADGRRNVLVFTRFITESEQLARLVPGTAVVTAETSPTERARILDGFRRGEIRCVTNVGVLALGFDYPELECVILARPTMSLALYYQQIGRVLRPHPDKPVAHVVDMVGLVKQFGRVEDLRIASGGKRGDSWTVNSGDRPLTNIYIGERDAPVLGAAAATAARARMDRYRNKARSRRARAGVRS